MKGNGKMASLMVVELTHIRMVIDMKVFQKMEKEMVMVHISLAMVENMMDNISKISEKEKGNFIFQMEHGILV